MEVTIAKNKNINLIKISGRLDASNAGQLENELNQLFAKKEYTILFNCETLDYISSAGLRVLLWATKQIKTNNGKMALSNLNHNVNQVFDISGFASVINIYNKQEDAISEFSSKNNS